MGSTLIPKFNGGTVTSPILLPDGTAAAPSLAWATNPTTGLSSPSVNQIYVSLSGTALARFVVGQIQVASTAQFGFSSGNIGSVPDSGIARSATGVVKVTNGGAGDGTLQSAGVIHGYAAKTADYTATATDYTIAVTPAANTTIALPAAASHTGRIYVVRKMDASANTVTIDPNAAETINGAATYVVPNTTSVMIQSTGTAWIILSVS